MLMREKFKVNNQARAIIFALLVICFISLMSIFASTRLQHMLILAALWAVVGMAWLLILMVGEFSFGQAGFLAIGAYSASIVTLKLGMSFWLGILTAALLSALIALAIGVVVLRLRGLYFAVVTLIFSEIIRLTAARTEYLGGDKGLWILPRPGDLGPISFSTKEGWFILAIFILIIAAVTCWRVRKTRIGRLYTWVGSVPDLAKSFGMHLMKYKVQAFVLSGFFTGLAGGVMAHYIRAINPDSFSLWFSLFAVMVAVIGGAGYLIAGPIVGSIVLIFFEEFLGFTGGPKTLTYGVLLLVIALLLPEGLLSIPRRLARKGKGRPLWHVLKLKS